MAVDRVLRAWRRWSLRRAGARIANDLQSFAPFFEGHAPGLSCGRGTFLSAGARIIIGRCDRGFGKLTIGEHMFMNHYAIIDCHDEMELGNQVLIGPHAYLCDFDHDIQRTDGSAVGSRFVSKPVRIGNHVWIGANTVILKGVTIGEGAVVGAGSVVTHDVPAMSVVAGNPARMLKLREPALQVPS